MSERAQDHAVSARGTVLLKQLLNAEPGKPARELELRLSTWLPTSRGRHDDLVRVVLADAARTLPGWHLTLVALCQHGRVTDATLLADLLVAREAVDNLYQHHAVLRRYLVGDASGVHRPRPGDVTLIWERFSAVENADLRAKLLASMCDADYEPPEWASWYNEWFDVTAEQRFETERIPTVTDMAGRGDRQLNAGRYLDMVAGNDADKRALAVLLMDDWMGGLATLAETVESLDSHHDHTVRAMVT